MRRAAGVWGRIAVSGNAEGSIRPRGMAAMRRRHKEHGIWDRSCLAG